MIECLPESGIGRELKPHLPEVVALLVEDQRNARPFQGGHARLVLVDLHDRGIGEGALQSARGHEHLVGRHEILRSAVHVGVLRFASVDRQTPIVAQQGHAILGQCRRDLTGSDVLLVVSGENLVRVLERIARHPCP